MAKTLAQLKAMKADEIFNLVENAEKQRDDAIAAESKAVADLAAKQQEHQADLAAKQQEHQDALTQTQQQHAATLAANDAQIATLTQRLAEVTADRDALGGEPLAKKRKLQAELTQHAAAEQAAAAARALAAAELAKLEK